MEIGFAYQSFKWKNSAAHNAGVTCAIVGLRSKSSDQKLLYEKDLIRQVKHISPYLIQGDNTIVYKRSRSIAGLPYMAKGNQPTDDGNLILSPREKDDLLAVAPQAAQFLHRYYGSQEFIKGIERWCLWIEDDAVDAAVAIPEIARRIEGVRQARLASKAKSTKAKAADGHRFIQIQDYGKEAIIVPIVSSERRVYLPVGIVDADAIISNLAFGIYDAPVYLLAVLSSRLHMAWVAAAGGRLKTDYRYSNIMVWNTFPVPDLSPAQITLLEEGAWAILGERERYTGRTISSLYDPKTMPESLLNAHREVDDTLERIYNGRPFANDTERLEHLFKRYKLMTAKEKAPLMITKQKPKRRVNVSG